MSGGILQFRITLVCLLAVLLGCAGAWAQEISGSIAGTVKDPSGAVVANATVTITNTDKNVVMRTLNTGGSGEFSAGVSNSNRCFYPTPVDTLHQRSASGNRPESEQIWL